MSQRPMSYVLAAVFAISAAILTAGAAIGSDFFKTKDAAISGENLITLRDVSPSDCMARCESERSFVCKSFDYNRPERWCDLSDKSAEDVGGLRRDYPGNPYDHYARARFKHTKDAAISGHNLITMRNVTPEQCKAACISERSFHCRSVDYNKLERWCDLSDKSAKDVGGLRRDYPGNPYDHYSRNW